MSERPEIWLVVHGEELVAELELERLDPPWLHGRALRRHGFTAVQRLFDREARLAAHMQDGDQAAAAWVDAFWRLRDGLRLLRPDGHEAPEFILHIDHDRARWRCWSHQTADGLADELPAGARTRAPARLARRTLATVVLALTAAVVLPAAALARRIHHQRSPNWAGYAVTAKAPFRSVSGRWVQPAAKCNQGFATYSAFWVGVGGFKKGSKKLERIGTETDCTPGGRARLFAWYELVPSRPVQLRARLRVDPGDLLAGRVTITGDRVLLSLQNLTTHRVFSKTVSFPAPDTSSAEWIAEAPSESNSAGNCQPLPLTDFGTVQFTDSTASTTHGPPAAIAAPVFTVTELTLSSIAPGAGSPPPVGPGVGPRPVTITSASSAATPTALSDLGTAFAVTYKQAKTPTPPALTPLAAPDQLRHARAETHRSEP